MKPKTINTSVFFLDGLPYTVHIVIQAKEKINILANYFDIIHSLIKPTFSSRVQPIFTDEGDSRIKQSKRLKKPMIIAVWEYFFFIMM